MNFQQNFEESKRRISSCYANTASNQFQKSQQALPLVPTSKGKETIKMSNAKFNVIKKAFDINIIGPEKFLGFLKTFNLLNKGEVTEKDSDRGISKKPPLPGIAAPTNDLNLSDEDLVAFAKKTSDKDLKLFVAEGTSDERLILAAKAELSKRQK